MLQIPRGNDLAVTAEGRIAPSNGCRDRSARFAGWRARLAIGCSIVFSIFILMPVALYPTFLRYHLPGTTDFNFLHFWWHMLTIGPWPSGSAWFLWVFAFYYPNNDVLNGDRPTPAARMDAMAGLGRFSGSYAYAATDSTANGASCAQRYHFYEPASGTFLGYGDRRYKCE